MRLNICWLANGLAGVVLGTGGNFFLRCVIEKSHFHCNNGKTRIEAAVDNIVQYMKVWHRDVAYIDRQIYVPADAVIRKV